MHEGPNTNPPETMSSEELSGIVEYLINGNIPREIVRENLYIWGPILFRAARSTSGKEREAYAEAFNKLRQSIDPQEYDKLLHQLFTNQKAIYELIDKGRREERESRARPNNPNSSLNKFKRFLGGQK